MSIPDYDIHVLNNLARYGQPGITLGIIDGLESVIRYGVNGAITIASTPESVTNIGGVYTGFPASAETMTIVSDSTEDALGGTGAHYVELHGQDENGDMQELVYALTGTTPVVTTEQWLRCCEAMCVNSAGSTETNVGTITLTHTTTTANVFGRIDPGKGVTKNALCAIPNGHYGWMNRAYVNAQNTATKDRGSCQLAVRFKPGLNQPWIETFEFWIPNELPQPLPFQGALMLPPRSDFEFAIIDTDTNDMSFAAGFDLTVMRMLS